MNLFSTALPLLQIVVEKYGEKSNFSLKGTFNQLMNFWLFKLPPSLMTAPFKCCQKGIIKPQEILLEK